MTAAGRLLKAVRAGTAWRALSHRLRQFTYANTHAGPHHLRIGRGVAGRLAAQPISFSIDVVSTCNLLCPTCPVANWPKESWTGARGIMEPALLHQLIRKAISECLVADVKLFAYTEPLLHPRLPELVEVVKSYGLPCNISTNLNVLRDADALLRAAPDEILVSVSGFHQETYAVSHAGGNIDVVKAHMRALADAKRRWKSRTRIKVLFHKYRTNAGDLPLMQELAASLGFPFDACWAAFFPLEKVLTYVQPELALAAITGADQRIIDRLGISIADVMAAAARTPVDACELQDYAVIMDVTGQVYLCCESAMDATRNRIASFLDTPLAELQSIKKRHSLCTTCMANGLPLRAMGGA